MRKTLKISETHVVDRRVNIDGVPAKEVAAELGACPEFVAMIASQMQSIREGKNVPTKKSGK